MEWHPLVIFISGLIIILLGAEFVLRSSLENSCHDGYQANNYRTNRSVYRHQYARTGGRHYRGF